VQSVLVPGCTHSCSSMSSDSSNDSTPKSSPQSKQDSKLAGAGDPRLQPPSCFGWGGEGSGGVGGGGVRHSNNNHSSDPSALSASSASSASGSVPLSPRFRTGVLGRIEMPDSSCSYSSSPRTAMPTPIATAQPIGGLSSLREGSHESSPRSLSESFKKRAMESPSWWTKLAVELRPFAAAHAKALPEAVLDAHAIVKTLGHTEPQAARLLERFLPYAKTQRGLMLAAAAAEAWVPNAEAHDRTQKSVRALSHAVKGAAGMICAARVSAISKELQFACDAITRVEADSEEYAAAVRNAKGAVEVWTTAIDEVVAVLESDPAAKIVQQKVAFGCSTVDRLSKK